MTKHKDGYYPTLKEEAGVIKYKEEKFTPKINKMEYTPQQKAQDLINMYYGHSKTQKEAIEMVDEVLLTNLCKEIDSLHGHHVIKKDYDEALVISSINKLKYWQEVAVEVKNIQNKLSV